MAKGHVSKDFNPVTNDPSRDGVEFFNNPGIEAPSSIPEDPGMKASNETKPFAPKEGMPSYPKGSGY